MKDVLFLSVLLLFSPNVLGCIIDPSQYITNDPDKYINNSEIVFFGELISLSGEHRIGSSQIAEFMVRKTYKGRPIKQITVINNVNTSCSKPLKDIGSNYYVFGNLSDKENTIKIGTHATFVPESTAQEDNMILTSEHD